MVNKIECVTKTVNATTNIENCQMVIDNYKPLYIAVLMVIASSFLVFLYFRITSKVIEKYKEAGGVTWDDKQ